MTTSKTHRARPLGGALIGLVAGLTGAYAMNRAQRLMSPGASSAADPSTVKAAQLASEVFTGTQIPDEDKDVADNAVHYGLGAVIGATYGTAAEIWPDIAVGGGAPFGIAVALILDESVVPALKISEPPWKTSAGTHAYSLASHVIFGLAMETTRRLLRRA